jgi:hypothetical protein
MIVDASFYKTPHISTVHQRLCSLVALRSAFGAKTVNARA